MKTKAILTCIALFIAVLTTAILCSRGYIVALPVFVVVIIYPCKKLADWIG